MGSLVAAAREFERIRHANPKYIPARVNLGLTYYTMGRRADALAEWQQILGLEPTNKSAAMYTSMVSHMPMPDELGEAKPTPNPDPVPLAIPKPGPPR